MCQTNGFGPNLFKAARSAAAGRKWNLDEEKLRRDHIVNQQKRSNSNDAENMPKICKHSTDGGLQKIYLELYKIERVLGGLAQLKDSLGDRPEDQLEKDRIDQGIQNLETIQRAHKNKVKVLVARHEDL